MNIRLPFRLTTLVRLKTMRNDFESCKIDRNMKSLSNEGGFDETCKA